MTQHALPALDSRLRDEGMDLRGREAERLRGLFDAHCELVFRTVRRLGVPPADADDAVQQVFIVTARKIGQIVQGAERAFLCATAVKVAADVRRGRRRRRETIDEFVPETSDPGPLPDERADVQRARALLDTILREMPFRLSAVFVLAEIEELGVGEVAAVLDIPVGTVASRLRSARQELRERLKRHLARGDWR